MDGKLRAAATRRSPSRPRGIALAAGGLLGSAAGLVAIAAGCWQVVDRGAGRHTASALLLVLLGGTLVHRGARARVRGRRLLVPDVPAPPDDELFVLYLRSRDPRPAPARRVEPVRHGVAAPLPLPPGLLVTGHSAEEQLSAALAHLGPVLVPARPGDPPPPAGTRRLRLPAEDRRRAAELMARARLVVISLGPGAVADLLDAAAAVPPERLLLVVPLRRGDYEEFRARLRAVSPAGAPRLPEHPASAGHDDWAEHDRTGHDGAIRGVVSFAADWTPTFRPVRPTAVRHSLATPLRRALAPPLDGLAAYEDGLPTSAEVARRGRRGETIQALGACLVVFALVRVGLLLWRLARRDWNAGPGWCELYVVVPALLVLLCGWGSARMGRRIRLRAVPPPRPVGGWARDRPAPPRGA
ncbi:hypothetical protein [Saccharothrix algeriensis]|uniref:Transferase n=1 Tax=Saccharothrix algeriensis TaxID=173560 RepID=A0ABS2RZG9_9PSEU|nr:hypothetical protein [Saccharothrix algeriensis]MBM7809375.1 hypothetical protein [Saccharothrix algeriensis]